MFKGSYCSKVLATFLLFLFVVLLSFIGVCAAPACPEPFIFTQSNGDTITLFGRGDEFLNWVEDENGNLVVREGDDFEYARWTKRGAESIGETVTSSQMSSFSVDDSAPSGGSKGADIPRAVLEKANRNREMLMKNNAPFNSFSLLSEPDAIDPARKLVIIHVTFPDDPEVCPPVIDSPSSEELYKLVFDPNEKSVNNYYMNLLGLSENVIEPIDGTNKRGEQIEDFADGVITVAFEGVEHSPYSDDFDDYQEPDMKKALLAALDKGLDLRDFTDPGYDVLTSEQLSICVIFDGYERSSDQNKIKSFWGSAGYGWEFRDGGGGGEDDDYEYEDIGYDMTVLTSFGQGANHRNSNGNGYHVLTMGIIAHEMGHSGYAFRDTYDYGEIPDGLSNGHGYWSLMSYGSWGCIPDDNEEAGETPTYVDAYNLVEFNLVKPTVLEYSDEHKNVKINNHHDIYKITTTDETGNQFFLLQQRNNDEYDRTIFQYDYSITEGGLLIYHMDYNASDMSLQEIGYVSTTDKNSHYLAAIEEAHGGVQNLQEVLGTPLLSNLGNILDLFGNDYSDEGFGVSKTFNKISDPGSSLYSEFTWDDVHPTQIIPSGVNIKNINWNKASKTTTFDLIGLPEMVTMAGALRNGVVGRKYETQLAANVEQDKFEIINGKLPQGLVLNSGTGVIHGTPAEKGISRFAVATTLDGETSLPVDYSITITEPSSSSGGVAVLTPPPVTIPGEIKPPANIDEGTGGATAVVTQGQIAAAIGTSANSNIIINIATSINTPKTETIFPASAFEDISKNENMSLIINTPTFSLTFDSDAISTIANAGATDDVKISVSRLDANDLTDEQSEQVGGRPVYEFIVTADDNAVTSFGGNVQVRLPYTLKDGENPNAIVIYYVGADGVLTCVPNAVYDPNSGTISFETNHFSLYMIGYNPVTFSDVTSAHWGRAAIEQAAARGLVAGVGNGRFDPGRAVSRAEFVQMMANVLQLTSAPSAAAGYADVNENAWYYKAVMSAKSAGLLKDLTEEGNNFMPNQPITREEMAVILANSAQYTKAGIKGTEFDVSNFSDFDAVDNKYTDQLTRTISLGLMSKDGIGGGKFDPKGATTRAQAAQVQMNVVKVFGSLE